jgi:DNA repair photolyase
MTYHKGRGAQLNTNNRFSETHNSLEHPEGIDEEIQLKGTTQVFYENARSVVNTIESPDLYAMRSVNPYQGCEHGCVMVAPLIPSINHAELPAIIKAAAQHGAISAGYTVVRLNGAVKDIFYDWLQKNFPARAAKVWNQIAELHGGQVNDSQWGRRMVGEGVMAKSIAQLFNIARQKYMKGGKMLPYDVSKFRRGGTYNLFSS